MPNNAKAALRVQQKNTLATLLGHRTERAHSVITPATFERLRTFPVIALYNALPDEFDPLPLGMALLECGHAIALPRVVQKGAPLVFCAWRPGDSLGPDVLGIPAPRADAPLLAPDLILAPLLAFDSDGNRLGRGAGYYDRTINALHARGIFPTYAGLAFDEQRARHVPATALDARMDFVITPAGIIECHMINRQA